MNLFVNRTPSKLSSETEPSMVGDKHAREPVGAEVADRPAKHAAVGKTKQGVRFCPAARRDDGPDVISRIAAQLIDDTLTRRVFDLNSLQASMRASMESSRLIFHASFTDLLASEGGGVMLQSIILTVIHKRFQALVDTITARAQVDGRGMFRLLPSHTQIGQDHVPVLATLQAAIHQIILNRCKPSPDDPQAVSNNTASSLATSKATTSTHAPTSTLTACPFELNCNNLQVNPSNVGCSRPGCEGTMTTVRRHSLVLVNESVLPKYCMAHSQHVTQPILL